MSIDQPLRGETPVKASLAVAALAALIVAAGASAHARVSPPVSLAKEGQLYSLAVPTEKENATTTKVVLTVPKGFSIDSFVASPGWTRSLDQTGSGESAVIQKVTWTGGHVPTGEDALFEFLGEPASAGTYTFGIEQTYSDGSIVNWDGAESSDTPAASIEARSLLGGGGGSSLLAIVALIVGGLGLVVGGVALLSRGGGGRELA
jgi:uncharacterized protein YcnI